MNKPERHKRESYNYNECRDFLQEKYGYEERDYFGIYKYHKEIKNKIDAKYGTNWYYASPASYNEVEQKAHDEHEELLKLAPKYADFWHWVCDNCNVSNGCYINFSVDMLDSDDDYIKPWQKEILKHYLDEFADKDGELEMWVEW